MAYNVSSFWNMTISMGGQSVEMIGDHSIEQMEEVAECDGMSAGERAFAHKETWGLDRGLLSLSLFGNHTQLISMIRHRHILVPEARARAEADSSIGFQAKALELTKPASSPLVAEFLDLPGSFESLCLQRRGDFKNFILRYLEELARDIETDLDSLPGEDQNRAFVAFAKLLKSDEVKAVSFLRQHKSLAFEIGRHIIRANPLHPDGARNFIRLQRFVQAQRGLFVLPPLYFDPSNTLQNTVARRYLELDDVDVAWEYLRVQFSSPRDENEEESAVRGAFAYDGFLYYRLCAAIEREVLDRPALFNLQEIRNGFETYSRDENPQPLRMFHLLDGKQVRKIIREGYDFEKGALVFSPESGFSASVFADEGVSHTEENTIVGIAHEMEWFAFAAFLAVAEGDACAGDGKIVVAADSTRLLSAMMGEYVIRTEVVFYACGINRHSIDFMKYAVNEGFDVDMDLGRRLEEVVGIPDPQKAAVADTNNEALYFYRLLFDAPENLQAVFEKMLDENPQMALCAKAFYAAIPYFTMPIVVEWIKRWENPSGPLQLFLYGILRDAAKTVRTFTVS